MALDQLSLDKWLLERGLKELDIDWGLLTVYQIIKEGPITKQHQRNDRRRGNDILEASDDEDTLSLMGRTWWGDVLS